MQSDFPIREQKFTSPEVHCSIPGLLETVQEEISRDSTCRRHQFQHNGELFWFKQVETLSLKQGLLKANPCDAFRREQDALNRLNKAKAKLPVAQIVAQGLGWFVTRHCGQIIRHLYRGQAGTLEERLAMFKDIGQKLAELHIHGFSHGRPDLKDICWDNQQATFIDFEAFYDRRNCVAGHARDVVLFVFFALADCGQYTPEIDQALRAYRAHLEQSRAGHIWQATQRYFIFRVYWLCLLSLPLGLILPENNIITALRLIHRVFVGNNLPEPRQAKGI
jgi:tRNA A-37 threonylcarbamoyl transferase component Bud32